LVPIRINSIKYISEQARWRHARAQNSTSHAPKVPKLKKLNEERIKKHNSMDHTSGVMGFTSQNHSIIMNGK